MGANSSGMGVGYMFDRFLFLRWFGCLLHGRGGLRDDHMFYLPSTVGGVERAARELVGSKLLG